MGISVAKHFGLRMLIAMGASRHIHFAISSRQKFPYFLFVCFIDRVLLSSCACPGTHYTTRLTSN